MMTQEQNKNVQTIVRETIAERFSSDEFVFDPIVVVPMVDEFGSDASGETYLRIIIVFDGDQKRLDSRWTSSFIRRIRPKLIEAGHRRVSQPVMGRKIRVVESVSQMAAPTPRGKH